MDPAQKHQQPHDVVSLASTSLVWPDRTAPQLRMLQLLLPDCVLLVLVITHTQYKVQYVQRSQVTSLTRLVPPPKHPTSIMHTHTQLKS